MDDEIQAIFVLRSSPEDVFAFENFVLQRSTPGNLHYGEWLSLSDLQSRWSSQSRNIDLVVNYLTSNGKFPYFRKKI